MLEGRGGARVGRGLAAAACVLVGCSATGAPGAAEPSTSPSSVPPTSDTAPASGDLPAAVSVEEVGALARRAAPFPDWVTVVGDTVWIANATPGVARFDATTAEKTGGADVPAEICLAMDEGFGALWAGVCSDQQRIVRIDVKTGRVVASIPLGEHVLNAESSLAAGDDGVWFVDGSAPARLTMVDPATNRVSRSVKAPESAIAVRAGFGSLWVTAGGWKTHLYQVDPRTGRVLSRARVGGGPRFLAVGAGSVWVMNQFDGTVTRVDGRTGAVQATTTVSNEPIEGGDIAASDDAVWIRVNDVLVARVDPATNAVTDRIGRRSGSGSVGIARGSVWVSAHDVTSVYRIPE